MFIRKRERERERERTQAKIVGTEEKIVFADSWNAICQCDQMLE